MPGQDPRTCEVFSVDGDVVTLVREFGEDGARQPGLGGQPDFVTGVKFSIATGRRLNQDNTPHPWDFWRLKA